ncbi:MAG: polysaccharide biosynthesis C-terminal domain-containing protein [Bacteroidota bacterium]
MDLKLTINKAFQFFHILRQLVLIAAAVLLTKSGVTQAEIGNYEMLFFLLFAVSFFWINGSIQGFLTKYPQLDSARQKQLIFQLFVCFSVLSLGVILLLLIAESSILQLLTSRPQLAHYHIFLIFIFFNLPTYLVENIYLLKERSKALIGFTLFSFLLQLVAIILPVWWGYSLRISFICLAILSILKYIWLIVLLLEVAQINWKFDLLWDTLKLSLPLMLYSLVGGFAQVFDSWLVNFQYDGDPDQFAIFRYGARELPFALAVATAFGSSMLPKLVKNRSDSIVEVREKSRILFHLLFPLAIIAAFSSQWLFPLILNPDFQESYLVFNIYLLILTSRLIFPHTILISLEQNKFIFYTSLVELVINITASFFLVQEMGLKGIALGTVIAYAFEKIVYIIHLHRQYQLPFHRYTDVRWWGAYSVILAGVVWWSV